MAGQRSWNPVTDAGRDANRRPHRSQGPRKKSWYSSLLSFLATASTVASGREVPQVGLVQRRPTSETMLDRRLPQAEPRRHVGHGQLLEQAQPNDLAQVLRQARERLAHGGGLFAQDRQSARRRRRRRRRLVVAARTLRIAERQQRVAAATPSRVQPVGGIADPVLRHPQHPLAQRRIPAPLHLRPVAPHVQQGLLPDVLGRQMLAQARPHPRLDAHEHARRPEPIEQPIPRGRRCVQQRVVAVIGPGVRHAPAW